MRHIQPLCIQCHTSFEITESDYQFLDKVSPKFGGQKFLIPPPTLCQDCRQQRRLCFRNERNLYRRKCDASGKDIIAMFSPDKPYKVYDQKIWRSDDRDPMKYARDFDLTKSFTEQFGALLLDVPYPSMLSVGSENCEYTCYTLDSKECYMSSGITRSEKVIYSYFIRGSDSMADCAMTYESSYCYECVDCFKLYNCAYCTRLIDSSSCIMCDDCTRCQYCIACSGLEDKIYYYKNQSIGKEVFEKLVANLGHGLLKQFAQELKVICDQQPKKFANILLSENVTGDNIVESQNCECCFDIKDCEDCKYIYFTPHGTSSQDCVYTAPVGVEYCYDVCSTMGTNSAFTFINRHGSFVYYSQHCHNCTDCFGCVGLRNKQFCIFNKQYTKDEYEKIVGTIIAHMIQTKERGEFFHPSLSAFGYNETIAQEYFPLDLVGTHYFASADKWVDSNPPLQMIDFAQFGYRRSDYIAPIPQVDKVVKGQDVADFIEDVTDDILRTAILCEVSNKPFRIVPQELTFYRKHNIPLPRRHPDIRHLDRMKLRNMRKLYIRNCDKCGVETQSTYPAEFESKVYCDKCYNMR